MNSFADSARRFAVSSGDLSAEEFLGRVGLCLFVPERSGRRASSLMIGAAAATLRQRFERGLKLFGDRRGGIDVACRFFVAADFPKSRLSIIEFRSRFRSVRYGLEKSRADALDRDLARTNATDREGVGVQLAAGLKGNFALHRSE
jgi:hypothetical protein